MPRAAAALLALALALAPAASEAAPLPEIGLFEEVGARCEVEHPRCERMKALMAELARTEAEVRACGESCPSSELESLQKRLFAHQAECAATGLPGALCVGLREGMKAEGFERAVENEIAARLDRLERALLGLEASLRALERAPDAPGALDRLLELSRRGGWALEDWASASSMIDFSGSTGSQRGAPRRKRANGLAERLAELRERLAAAEPRFRTAKLDVSFMGKLGLPAPDAPPPAAPPSVFLLEAPRAVRGTAASRRGLVHEQDDGNCGVVAQQQVLAELGLVRPGKDGERALVAAARAAGTHHPELGSSVAHDGDLLAERGVPYVKRVRASEAELDAAAGSGRAVILTVDMRRLNGEGPGGVVPHAILVTGVERGRDGGIAAFRYNDSQAPGGVARGREISRARLLEAWRAVASPMLEPR